MTMMILYYVYILKIMLFVFLQDTITTNIIFYDFETF